MSQFLPHVDVKEAPLVAQLVKNPPVVQETLVRFLGQENLLEEGMANPLQYSCQEKPHGHRSLACYSPRGCKELDTTERLSTAQHTDVKKRGTIIRYVMYEPHLVLGSNKTTIKYLECTWNIVVQLYFNNISIFNTKEN